MGICDGRVVVITGAGRGIGREHALEFASQGANVVVNDLGAEIDGTGSSAGPAGEVVDEIRGMGGEAVANGDDVVRLRGRRPAHPDRHRHLRRPRRPRQQRRDPARPHAGQHDHRRVGRRHPRPPAGHLRPDRHAVEYWRNRSKAGETNDARIINTTSPSGIYGNVGQTNYGAAKAGIASFTVIAAMELGRYGVTVNAIAPAALTRMTENLGMGDRSAAEQARGLRPARPGQHRPAGRLAGEPRIGRHHRPCLQRAGGHISVAEGWVAGPGADKDDRWDPAELGKVVPDLVAKAAPNANMGGKRD